MTLEQITVIMQRWAGAAAAAIEAGKDVVPFVQQVIDTFGGDGVTDEKLAKLRAYNDAAHEELQKPVEDDPEA